MGLLNRIKGRLFPKKAEPGIGPGFRRADEADWKDLDEQVDNYTQKTGAAIVQSWEVGAAELGRVVKGRATDKQSIERFSDALVPVLTPFQDLHKRVSGVMKQGWEQGVATGRLDSATGALVPLVSGLGVRAQEGWAKAVEYLDPIFAECADPPVARATMLAHGAALRTACDAAEAVLVAELAKGPSRATLWAAVTDPFDLWQLALVRELEITITRATRELVASARG